MVKKFDNELDFIIDGLTNSILNVITGDSFETEIVKISNSDLQNIKLSQKWNFDWENEFKDNSKQVYKLTIINNLNVIQGLISLSIESDHVFINLLENADFNIGKRKIYAGVAGNLVAFACKTSFNYGYEGHVVFTAKSKLIKHYEKSLGAFHIFNQRMIIDTKAAYILVNKYFKN